MRNVDLDMQMSFITAALSSYCLLTVIVSDDEDEAVGYALSVAGRRVANGSSRGFSGPLTTRAEML